MKGIILAAGRGSRLKNFTHDKPKCMVELKGKPLLEYQIQALTGSGIEDIAIVSGYLKEKIKHSKITHFFENKFWSKTNMVYSLMQADSWLSNHTCIVSYSDIFYSSTAVQKLVASKDLISVTFDPNFAQLWTKRFTNPLDDLESFKVDASCYLSDIGQKATDISHIEGQYMGLLKFTPSGWLATKKVLQQQSVNSLDMTTLLYLLLQQNVKVKAIAINDEWGEVDHVSDLRLYEQS